MTISDGGDNIVLSLVNFDTPDPFVVKAPNGIYYMTFTCGDRVDVLVAASLAGFLCSPRRHTIWVPPPSKPWSKDVWAPELHALNDRWYVYFASADPRCGNASHRMYVLGGPPSSCDPALGIWEFLGPFQGLPTEQWAIDGTICTLYANLYFVYSGWPIGEKESDLMQELFIIRLAEPTRAIGTPVRISKPEHPWEFTRDKNGLHGINEGPQFLSNPDGTWIGIAYSCAGSWTKAYKMNVLEFTGQNPLSARSWQKAASPLLQTAPIRRDGPWGPGHGNFINLGSDMIGIFHATDAPHDGWNNRKARVQRLFWTRSGPSMGDFLGHLTTDLDTFTKFHTPNEAPTNQVDDKFHASFNVSKAIR